MTAETGIIGAKMEDIPDTEKMIETEKSPRQSRGYFYFFAAFFFVFLAGAFFAPLVGLVSSFFFTE